MNRRMGNAEWEPIGKNQVTPPEKMKTDGEKRQMNMRR
jgi:hypothetical protein